MKKIYIFILVVIAVAMAIIVGNLGDFSTYETFATASKEPGKTFVVVANLDTTKTIDYDPLKNANQFSFYAVDKKDEVQKVIFMDSKPTDFERAEQLVMTGHMNGDVFVCEKVQMKCPSKYENDQIAIANDNQS